MTLQEVIDERGYDLRDEIFFSDRRSILGADVAKLSARESLLLLPVEDLFIAIETGYEKSISRIRNIRFVITKDGKNNIKDFMTDMPDGSQMVFPFATVAASQTARLK